MSYKKASDDVKRNSAKWSQNLSNKVKRRSLIPQVEVALSECTRMTRNKDILGRFLYLSVSIKDKAQRIRIIVQELKDLWKKLNFPSLNPQTITVKLQKLINNLEKYKRKKTQHFESELLSLFDLTKEDGLWLSTEDKKLYKLQRSTKGKVGYTTGKAAPISSIHPSK